MTRLRRRTLERSGFAGESWRRFLKTDLSIVSALTSELDTPLGMFCGGSEEQNFGYIRRAWELQRESVLAEWILENPGSRPPAWWIYDAPESRRQVGGGGTIAERPDACIWTDPPAGCPRLYLRYREAEPIYESEIEYLRRHGLLSRSEIGCGRNP